MKNSANDVQIGAVSPEGVQGPYSLLTLDDRLVAHDLAGDGTLLFVAQFMPLGTQCVRVFHQGTKRELGRFPVPPRGFVMPFKFRLGTFQPLGKDGSKGIVYLMDSVYPKIIGSADALIIKYEYEYDGRDDLKMNLVKEHRIPTNTIPWNQIEEGATPNGAIYPTGFDVIDDTYIAVADCLGGAIWLYDVKTGELLLAFTGPGWGAQPWPEDLKATLPDGGVVNGFTGWTHKNREELVPYVHVLPTVIVPGLHGLTLYKNRGARKVVFVSVAIPSIFAIDVAELIRTDIAPQEKQFEAVVRDIRGVASWVGEVQDDRYNPGSPWVYFHRSMSKSNEPARKGYEKWVEKYNPLYRVNMETGGIEYVAEDWKLWDLDSCMNVIPWKPGFARLTSTPVQQHRLPGTSGLIDDPDDFSRLPEDFVFPVIDVKS